MGLIVKHRKKYVSHKKRWDKETIVDEVALVQDYALKNKKEIRKVEFMISKYKKIAKELNQTEETKNSEAATKFLAKLHSKGFLSDDANTLDDVLDIKVRNVLERRLSNLVYKRQLSRTPSQARQFVVHRHVLIGGKLIDSPSYLVSVEEEAQISFRGKSSLADENHPERNLEVQQGLKDELKKMEETPVVENNGPNADEAEAKMDDEEQDEVKE